MNTCIKHLINTDCNTVTAAALLCCRQNNYLQAYTNTLIHSTNSIICLRNIIKTSKTLFIDTQDITFNKTLTIGIV